jgi:ribonucleotide monophosphatase NagD (HAD superfamily)
MIRNATGRYPVFIGKPEPTMLRIVMEKFGCTPEETLVVGDRVYTDIASGVHAGVDTVGVLSGEATRKDFQSSDTPPTWLFENVRELWRAL